jgi:hypothetical protein
MCIKLTDVLQKRPQKPISLLCCWNDVTIHGVVSIQKNTICNRTGVTDDLRVGCSPTGWVRAESLTNILEMFSLHVLENT